MGAEGNLRPRAFSTHIDLTLTFHHRAKPESGRMPRRQTSETVCSWGDWASPKQAESTAPGNAGNRAFEALYYNDTACKSVKSVFGSLLRIILQAVPTYICWLIYSLGQRPKPFEQPLLGLAARSETER